MLYRFSIYASAVFITALAISTGVMFGIKIVEGLM
jgi:hypothetical protein